MSSLNIFFLNNVPLNVSGIIFKVKISFYIFFILSAYSEYLKVLEYGVYAESIKNVQRKLNIWVVCFT